MQETSEDLIRERAYELWEKHGSPTGQDKEFWAMAERELAEAERVDISEQAAEVTRAPVPAGFPAH